ncbi:hypothetical protein [Bacterioplanoides sp. SCSIO 12839]|uniref:hypothetical protein n=1 Tax=Bacterioplanoides sp. SCSIO 12839 TaxID=2829569 RepID=UPI002104B26D|nr:hypothetical protein [Bacterioplanoides sp. SCSIO 12839]UTW47941.1 hypothetical protein KFF03_15485 [Bacterioplanoides sp. SCSIO 12839]
MPKSKLIPTLLSSAIAASALVSVTLPSISYANNEGAVAWILPGDQWKTLETEHFAFHFLEQHQQMAKRAATISETQWPILTKRLGWTPKDKVQVVLTDDIDASNGWAHVEPFNQMRLFLSPPDGGTTLEAYDDWLNLLITHELTHVIHIDMARGIPGSVRKILGRHTLTFPHAYQPGFLIEGLAVYTETNHELGLGRGQSKGYDMQMRMEVLNGIDDLNQVAITLRDWPIGKHYLYGYYYYQFLTDTYGEDKLREYLALYSRNLVPFNFLFLNPDARKVFGKNYQGLWQEFRSWLQQRFEPQIADIQQQKMTSLNTVSNEGYSLDASASNGKDYYYLYRNGEDRQHIVKVNESGSLEKLAEVKDANNIDVNTNGDVLYTRLVNRADGRAYADIFMLKDQQEIRLTKNKRYRDIRWMPVQQNQPSRILAKRLKDGVSQLDLLSAQGDPLNTLWQGTLDDVLGEFSVSPDGNTIIATVKRKNQGWNLELFDINKRQWRAITNSKAIETGPQFIDNNTLIYAADYETTYNIYTLDLTTQKISQLTHLMGGALSPEVVNNKVYLQNYTADGYEHSVIEDAEIIQSFSLTDIRGEYNYPDPYSRFVQHSDIQDYSPWKSLVPTRWMPILGGDDNSSFIGASIDGKDALLRHSYEASLIHDTTNGVSSGSLQYFYDNKWQFSFLREHEYNERDINNEERLQVRESDVIEIARINLFSAFENELQFSLGLHSDKEKDLSGKNSDKRFIQYEDAKQEGLVGARIDFSNAEGFLHSPGTSWGHQAAFIWETNDAISSDYDGNRYNLNWSVFTDLPGTSVLAFNTSNAYGDDDAKRFDLGGNDLQTTDTLFGRDSWALRGYSDTVQSGSRLNVNTLEWRTRLGDIERNWDIFPLGLGNMSANVFVDSGAAWQDQQDAKYLTSAGVEFSTELVVFYAMPLPLRLGYAHGFDKDEGKDEVYLSIGYQF